MIEKDGDKIEKKKFHSSKSPIAINDMRYQ